MPAANTNHTPGPWRADRRAILAGNGTQIKCLAEVFSGAAASLEEAVANELLIAAAPDLVEVVQRLLREDSDGEYTIGLIEDARDAIAKAEGRA
ncbi:MAG: hypothetical protein HY066_09020 [Betaproteobacteria bacterium]|nr:hypothetical protein [Betaproteobacteria bacterium]